MLSFFKAKSQAVSSLIQDGIGWTLNHKKITAMLALMYLIERINAQLMMRPECARTIYKTDCGDFRVLGGEPVPVDCPDFQESSRMCVSSMDLPEFAGRFFCLTKNLAGANVIDVSKEAISKSICMSMSKA